MSTTDKKGLNLVDYLSELARLRSSLVRTVSDYNKVLWFSNVPADSKYCASLARGAMEDDDQEIWLEVTKYAEPVLDELPDDCVDWVNNETLFDPIGFPELHERRVVQRKVEEPAGAETADDEEPTRTETVTLHLDDFPGIKANWEKYVEDKWLPWAELHKSWQRVHEVYSALFSIHQEQLKLGEEYELVLGVGLLCWRSPQQQSVKRHLIVAKASLTFDPSLGRFQVRAAPEGAKLAVEFDMLDVAEQPPNARDLAHSVLASCDDNPWDRVGIDNALAAITNSLADDGAGVFSQGELDAPAGSPDSIPRVCLAPALILRKRSVKGLLAILEEIRKQIKEGATVPYLFSDLCEGVTEWSHSALDSAIDDSSSPKRVDDIYFPLPFNREQRKIIERMNVNPGVLVQGPPGTGKSHTIANLICHLLASGKRVLVTAKTPRALQVLHQKLPRQIQPLCINFIDGGGEETHSLEESVSGILRRRDAWDEARDLDDAKRFRQNLDSLRKELAQTNGRIRSIREKETFEHRVGNGKYVGTAAAIARAVEKDRSRFYWFTDVVAESNSAPFSTVDLISLQDELCRLAPEETLELAKEIPAVDAGMCAPDELDQLFADEASAIKAIEAFNDPGLSQTVESIRDVNTDIIGSLRTAVRRLVAEKRSVLRRPREWIAAAVYDMLSDQNAPWEQRFLSVQKALVGLRDRAVEYEQHDLVLPPEADYVSVLADAETVYEDAERRGKLKIGFLAPSAVRKRRYLFESVKIDGKLCQSTENIQLLIALLSFRRDLDRAWRSVDDLCTPASGQASVQVAEISEILEALEQVISLFEPLEQVKREVSSIPGAAQVAWHDDKEIEKLLRACDAVLAKNQLGRIKEAIDRQLEILRIHAESSNSHRVSVELLSATKERDAARYRSLFREVEELHTRKEEVAAVERQLQILERVAPQFVKALRAHPADPSWTMRLREFSEAWEWSRAQYFLTDLLAEDTLDSLERRARRIEDDISAQTADLCAVEAWRYCCSRLDEPQRRHLMAWQQAVKRIGKGTGKYAHRHRRDAQFHLNESRDAVPAWIMPLHRVYESVDPQPEMFDAIIVDEASQCGPEGLPLTFLAKHLIVVGDDQQISPEAVGIEQSQVHGLMRQYLRDFTHANAFGVESSLFDHAKLRFGSRIVLREHFRCMPEIIRFSNDLCYRSTPLVPLREYPPDRLEPLQSVYVDTGYREGNGSATVNRPEAEALVSKIVECCADPRYEDKTMGVIILQGNAQAGLIEEMLLQELDAEELERRRILCGNPYSFQGDERDVMFLSMVAAPNLRIGTLSQAADERRFNVAASRGRDQVWLFHSVTRNDLSSSCLRRRLLAHFESPQAHTQTLGLDCSAFKHLVMAADRAIEKPPTPFDSWFETDVYSALVDAGYRVIPQYEVAGRRIDLVVEGAKSRLAVECDGDHWHGIDNYESDVERQRLLERRGWVFHRVRESRFYAQRGQTIESLITALSRQKVQPVATDRDEKVGATIATAPTSPEGLRVVSPPAREPQFARQPSLFLFGDEKGSRINGSHAVVTESPQTIHDALAMQPRKMKEIILGVLGSRPNETCKKDDVARFVLQSLGIVTRGKPREQFSQKISQNLNALKREGRVEFYKSKNERVRLLD